MLILMIIKSNDDCNYNKLNRHSHGGAGLSLTSSQQTGGCRIGLLTARSKKGHMSLVIPPSERDVQGHSHVSN